MLVQPMKPYSVWGEIKSVFLAQHCAEVHAFKLRRPPGNSEDSNINLALTVVCGCCENFFEFCGDTFDELIAEIREDSHFNATVQFEYDYSTASFTITPRGNCTIKVIAHNGLTHEVETETEHFTKVKAGQVIYYQDRSFSTVGEHPVGIALNDHTCSCTDCVQIQVDGWVDNVPLNEAPGVDLNDELVLVHDQTGALFVANNNYNTAIYYPLPWLLLEYAESYGTGLIDLG